MTSMDLFISCDTALAHLAGGLGCPTFLALHDVSDWRWLLEGADNPWYPATRLFRQSSPGDWSGVFARIAEVVRERAP